jgi:hypothetical protein
MYTSASDFTQDAGGTLSLERVKSTNDMTVGDHLRLAVCYSVLLNETHFRHPDPLPALGTQILEAITKTVETVLQSRLSPQELRALSVTEAGPKPRVCVWFGSLDVAPVQGTLPLQTSRHPVSCPAPPPPPPPPPTFSIPTGTPYCGARPTRLCGPPVPRALLPV